MQPLGRANCPDQKNVQLRYCLAMIRSRWNTRKAAVWAVILSPLFLLQICPALQWVHEHNGDPLVFLHSGNPSYSSVFNILLDGYQPATMQVDSAVASFAFADNYDSDPEYVNIFLDGNLFLGGLEVDGTHQNIPHSFDWYHGNLSGTLLAGLQDGIISYTVTITSGDAYLKRAKLVAEGSYRTVADGGLTVLLLGGGMIALGLVRWFVRPPFITRD
jgi:hypothetical protein